MKATLVLSIMIFATVADASAPQVIVLRNGNVLTGQIDRLADGFFVTTATSEFRLSARDVERVVATLQDAYEAKRLEVREDSVSDRLELAMWCMRQELWIAAKAELDAAQAIDGRSPRIPYLQRRLEVLSRAAMRAAQPAEVEASPKDESTQQKAAELARLEALVAELPEGTLEDFARHVQPILVNGCAAGGCHSTSDKRSFQLNRDLVRGVANRESTLRNLESVWNAIDQNAPDYSPLLLQPAVPHGGLAQPVFAGHRGRAQDRLVEWVRKATGKEPPTPEATSDPVIELAGHEAMLRKTQPTDDASLPSRPRHFWEDPAAMGLEDASAETPTKPAVKFGAVPRRFQPRDEFDPELFNRRQSPPRDATSSESAQ